ELPELLGLYAMLHPDDPVFDPHGPEVQSHWHKILADPNLRYYVAEQEGKLVATCTLTIIPNLTRQLRPFGVIENVVTHPAYRRRGFATNVLRCALEDAWLNGCYKVMLASGSKEDATLRFYEKAGFLRGVKTGFVAYPHATATD
ncbi:MAG: GNAT family N-acetyltransferase, partial [Lacunisphaera sp.]